MDANQIATLIDLTATAAHEGKIPMQTASGIIRQLWALAGEQNRREAVDAILQGWSEARERAFWMNAQLPLPQDGSAAI